MITPKIFIGSSVESLEVAEAVKESLEYVADCVIWKDDVFGPSAYTIDALLDASKECDFSIFIFNPDDTAIIRKEEKAITRANVIFELGLFMGEKGLGRTFILLPRNVPNLDLPTDLLGITPLNYDASRDDLVTAVGTACNKIKRHIASLQGSGNQLSLTGSWVQKWKNNQPTWDDCVEGSAEVVHTENSIYSKFECRGIEYELSGDISNGNVLTGIWKSPHGGPGYVGAVQLRVSQDAKTMSGKWVGIDSTQTINADEWLWEKSQEET